MSVLDTVTELCAFPGRGAGTDAERRAADWLAREAAQTGGEVTVETFWCRPDGALAQAWHVALALAGSVVMVSDATTGGLIALAALICLTADALTGVSPGRRLTPQRASQNVVCAPAGPEPAGSLRLLVTAPYDAGRCGLVHAPALRAASARLRAGAGGGRLALGWLGWVALGIAWLVAVAVTRRLGDTGVAIAVAQVIPTIGLVAVLAALLQLAGARYGPAASDDAAGVAVALALGRVLCRAPSRQLRVTILLSGAGPAGLRHHLRTRRAALRGTSTAVLGIAACGAGTPRVWRGDGPLWPVAFHPRLYGLARRAAQELTPDASPAPGHRGRGAGPALGARLAGLPAVTIGCLDDRGRAPRSHRPDDLPEAVDPGAVGAALQLALTFAELLDADVAPDPVAGDGSPPTPDAVPGRAPGAPGRRP